MLVATTVIEVGIDVPNATVMLIEHAERFGLSQLHQLRGRVGRGAARVDLHPAVPHGRLSEEARARIEVMAETTDGFVIAEKDLELRGPGDFFGTRQSGLPPAAGRRPAARSRPDGASRARRPSATWRKPGRGRAEDRSTELLERGGWQRRFGLARVGLISQNGRS